MVKISVNGDDKAVGTKLFFIPELWENGKAKGKSAEANEINGQLKEVFARLTNHYHRILREEDFVTAEKLRNAFLGVGVMENCILKDFEHMNKEFGAMVEKGQRAKSTYNKYLAVYNHFKTFLWEKKKRTDMAYKELTKEIITDFDKYLRVEKGLSANTLWIYTMLLLSLTDKAWRRGIVRTDPFSEYNLEMQETDRGYLTEEELRITLWMNGNHIAYARFDGILMIDGASLAALFSRNRVATIYEDVAQQRGKPGRPGRLRRLLDTPLDAFGLSQRIVRACQELGVFTVEHLLVHLRRFRFSRLYCVRNFGSGSAAETLRRLRQDGLTDGGSPRDFKVLYP